jgi:hypothetical protein
MDEQPTIRESAQMTQHLLNDDDVVSTPLPVGDRRTDEHDGARN